MAIRYDKKFNNEINKIVRAYNSKINRLSKKDENYVYYLVVKNLKRRRKLNGLTQREFADVLDIDIRELFKPIDDDK